MIMINTLIGRADALIHRYLAPQHRQLAVDVAVPEENHTDRVAAVQISYFGTLVVTGSYRSDGEITFRS
jgi:hypothetical protein